MTPPAPFRVSLPVLIAGPNRGVWREGGVVEALPATRILAKARETPPLLCHGPASARRLGTDPFPCFDLLELFAFVRPAAFVVPTPSGLAAATGQKPPGSRADEAAALAAAAECLVAELGRLDPANAGRAREAAAFMGRADWIWADTVAAALGPGAADRRGLRVFDLLPDIEERGPPPPPGDDPVTADEARAILRDLLGSGAESRAAQSDYAAVVAQAFRPRADEDAPRAVLAEAGTGTGKTAAYLAPASLWARRNGGTVWVSTFTRNLQHQLDRELDRVYPPEKKRERAVVRKGRENYLCLLNFEEMLDTLPPVMAGRDAIALGLVARWALATRGGDMVGGDFPNWLAALLGRRATLDLTDNRGECTYSACTHYRRCFIEHSIRRARRADIVVANHALVMAQAALGGLDDNSMPTRYVFDEGHHVFDAADSAFSVELSGAEARELRRWLIGGERGSRRNRAGSSRARGLEARLADIAATDEMIRSALDALRDAATLLPAESWLQRIARGEPAGPFEAFLAEVRRQVHARAKTTESVYSLEAELDPPDSDLVAAGLALDRDLAALQLPLVQLSKRLDQLLDDRAGELEPRDKARLDGVARSLKRRGEALVAAWRTMLQSLRSRATEAPEAYVDWLSIDQSDGRASNVGMHRHWVDPTLPFAEAVIKTAHGVVVTSATLRDSDEAEDQGWSGALARTGLAHLVEPPQRASFPSPFDYARQTRVIVVTDVKRDDARQVAAAFRALFLASHGGALGLFTAIRRLREVHGALAPALEQAGLPLYAQHVDALDASTLVDIFRAEKDACLLGTDALRDGIDVPGDALRLIVFDRVPWVRPTVLHRRRRAAFGGGAYDDALIRLRLKQAFGRLVRRADDRGVFVLLDAALPSRLLSAFPPSVAVDRLGLKDAAEAVSAFFAPAPPGGSSDVSPNTAPGAARPHQIE